MAEPKTQAEIEAEEKAAKEAEAKKQAEAEAALKNQLTVDADGNVKLTEEQYKNLVGFKDDMHKYKERAKTAEAELETKSVAELKAVEDQLVKDKKFEELAAQREETIKKMEKATADNQIISALTIAAIEAGIANSEYVKLIDKSKVIRDEETGEISGIDEIIKSFKEDKPELFKSDTAVPPDKTLGGVPPGVLTDEQVLAIPGKKLMELKKANDPLYDRWAALCKKGKP